MLTEDSVSDSDVTFQGFREPAVDNSLTQITLLSMDSLHTDRNSSGLPEQELSANTLSTNDSHDAGSAHLSSPSVPRGGSSDDGWHSETTETSGNVSLSQYPLDDQSTGDSVQNSVQDEAVNSAIIAVSGDFIAGNFSPGNFTAPGHESDSSQSSTGEDRKSGQMDAVYARYPETAVGMSDNEWNPYSESDNNNTPRSSASDDPAIQRGINTTAGMRKAVDAHYGAIPPPQEFDDAVSSAAKRNVRMRENGIGCEMRKDFTQTEGYCGLKREMGTRTPKRSKDYTVDKNKESSYILYPPELETSSDSNLQRQTSGRSLKQEAARVDINEPTRSLGEPVHSYRSTGLKDRYSSGESAYSNISESREMRNRTRPDDRHVSGESADSLNSDRPVNIRNGVDSEDSRRSSGGSSGSVKSDRSSRVRNGMEELKSVSSDYKSEVVPDDYQGRTGYNRHERSSHRHQPDKYAEDFTAPSSRYKYHPSGKEQPSSSYDSAYGNAQIRSNPKMNDSLERHRRRISDPQHRDEDSYIPVQEREKIMSKMSARNASVRDRLSDGRYMDPTSSETLRKHVDELIEETSNPGRDGDTYPDSKTTVDSGETGYSIQRPSLSLRPESKDYNGDEARHMLNGYAEVVPKYSASQTKKEVNRLLDRHADLRKQENQAVSAIDATVGKISPIYRHSKDVPSYDNRAENEAKSRDGDTYRKMKDGREKQNNPDNKEREIRQVQNSHEYRVNGEHGRLTERRENPPVDREKVTESRSRQGSQSSVESDVLGKMVRNVLSETAHMENPEPISEARRTESLPYSSYIPTTMDYSRLHRDLQEIQNSLKNELPENGQGDGALRPRSATSEADTGRDGTLRTSKASELDQSVDSLSNPDFESVHSKKLLWDHAADLGYDDSVAGRFYETESSLSQKYLAMANKMENGDGERTLEKRPRANSDGAESRSSGTDSTCKDVADLTQEPIDDEADDDDNKNALTNETSNVDNIIQRYRDERQQMEGNFQSANSGLADRVFRILTQEHPHKQVYGILEEAMEEERKMLKKISERPKMDSSYDGFSIDQSDSFNIRDRDVRKQLEWSQLSSPGKMPYKDRSEMSELSTAGISEAPFNAVGNAKTLLSSQLQKMSERTFNHSVEHRTPYRTEIACYPVYGVERQQQDTDETARKVVAQEAWPEDSRDTNQGPTRHRLDPQSERDRFYLTETELEEYRTRFHLPGERHRTYSDPFELSPGRRHVDSDREGHVRSRSEEGSILGSERFYNLEPSSSMTDRRAASSPRGRSEIGQTADYSEVRRGAVTLRKETFSSPSPAGSTSPIEIQDSSQGSLGVNSSLSESDSSTMRRRELARMRPYRPVGSQNLYYTESGDDTASVADSITTQESTHAGSDDAVGPYFPPHVLGSRREEPVKHIPGVYSSHKHQHGGALSPRETLSTIEEKSVTDEKNQSDSGVDNPGSSSDTRNPGQNPSRESGTNPMSIPGNGRKSPYSHTSSYHVGDRDGDIRNRDMVYGGDSGSAGRMQLTGQSLSANVSHPTRGDNTRLKDVYSRPRDLDNDRYREKYRDDLVTERNRPGYESRLSDQQLGISTRSDPGATDVAGRPGDHHRDASVSDSELQLPFPRDSSLEVRPARSRSEADLDALSPGDGKKSSSPLHGNRTLEMSVQPSPIYSHHTSVNSPALAAINTGSRVRSPAEVERLHERTRSPVLKLDEPDRHRARSKSPIDRSGERGRKSPIDRELERLAQNGRNSPMDINGRGSPIDSNLRKVPADRVARNSPAEQAVQQRADRIVGREATNENQRLDVPLDNPGHHKDRRRNPQSAVNTEEDDFGSDFDQFPPSRRAQLLRQALEQEYQETLPPNINDMWTRFQELNQSDTLSSMNTTRMEALADLIRDPTKHLVKRYYDEREQQREQRKVAEDRAAREREMRRQEMRNQHRLSEEESNGSYAEVLQQRQQRQRGSKIQESGPERNGKEKRPKEIEKSKPDMTSDSVDTLYSIPEDSSFDWTRASSYAQSDSVLKTKHARQRHIIDPLMGKLKDKIKVQKDKIDKERRKDVRRMEKLKKLEMLLNAKKKGKLSDKAIDVEMGCVSTTSAAPTDSSTLVSSENESSYIPSSQAEMDTTNKDSSTEFHQIKQRKSKEKPHLSIKDAYKAALRSPAYIQDSESQTETENCQPISKTSKRAEKRSPSRKSSSRKGKKPKVDSPSHKRSKKASKVIVEDSEATLNTSNRKSRRHEEGSPTRQRVRDVGTMYPSPLARSPHNRHQYRDVIMVSEAIQTTPGRSFSPSRDMAPAIPVPLMSSKSKKRSQSPPPKSRMFTPETPEDSPVKKDKGSPKGVAWYIPVPESKPWRKPLKERQAFAVRQEPWKPKSIPPTVWKNIVERDYQKEKAQTQNQLEKEPQLILEKQRQSGSDEDSSDMENDKPKPLGKMTLQEAFQRYKEDAISKSRERQKRLQLAAEERRLQHYLDLERDQIFADRRRKEANPEAHPLSENLHKPKRRALSKEEMKELTEKLYKNCAEVVEKKKLEKRNNEYSLNRLKARIFNRKVQKKVLKT